MILQILFTKIAKTPAKATATLAPSMASTSRPFYIVNFLYRRLKIKTEKAVYAEKVHADSSVMCFFFFFILVHFHLCRDSAPVKRKGKGKETLL